MPRFAPALAAAALLTFAAPALALADGPTCGNADLVYSEAGEQWITSDGLFDAMQVLGDGFAAAGRSLWREAGDREHGADLRVKDTYQWLADLRDADPSDTVAILGKYFDRAASEYDGEAADITDDIRAESRDHRAMRRLSRMLRAWIRIAEAANPAPGSSEAAALEQLRAKRAALARSLSESRKELRTLRAERRAAQEASQTLKDGTEWVETAMCVFEQD